MYVLSITANFTITANFVSVSLAGHHFSNEILIPRFSVHGWEEWGEDLLK